MTIDQIRAEAEAATKGPWDVGPETGVGHVWVYASSSPLIEPMGLNGWFAAKCRELKVKAIGVLRGDGIFRYMHEENAAFQTRFWQQKQKDAQFIAHSRTNVPLLCDALEEAIAWIEDKEQYRSVSMSSEGMKARIARILAGEKNDH